MSDAHQIWQAIEAANAAWLGGRPLEVAPLFHDEAVMATPDGRPFRLGIAAVVQSYEDYCRQATTHGFDVTDRAIHVFGGTAVVSYRFRVRYEHGGEEHDETGGELMVFARQEEGWRAVWRMQLPAGGAA